MTPTLPSVAQGFALAAGGAWPLFFIFLGILIRQIGPWRKQSMDAEQRLREDLLTRVEKLESTLDRERAVHNAERALDRHRLNNITACFDAFLMLVKTNPDKAGDAVAMVEDMRSKQLIAEAAEKAGVHAVAMGVHQEEL